MSIYIVALCRASVVCHFFCVHWMHLVDLEYFVSLLFFFNASGSIGFFGFCLKILTETKTNWKSVWDFCHVIRLIIDRFVEHFPLQKLWKFCLVTKSRKLHCKTRGKNPSEKLKKKIFEIHRKLISYFIVHQIIKDGSKNWRFSWNFRTNNFKKQNWIGVDKWWQK